MYNNDLYLVDVQYIKDNSELFINIEPKFIEPVILRVQNIFIQDLVGSRLYGIVLNAYDAFYSSGTTIPTRLYDLTENYILPAITHRVIFEIIPTISFQITPQGVLQRNLENGSGIDISSQNYFRKILEDNSQFYGERLVNFLLLNSNTYPEYLSATGNDDIVPSNSSYNNFFVGGYDRKNRNPYCCGE